MRSRSFSALLISFALPCVLFPVTASIAAPIAGKTLFVKNEVLAGSRPLRRGSTLYAGEKITTGSDGYTQLRFKDNTVISLRGDAKYTIKSYRYDKTNPKKNGMVVNLTKGAMRIVTGKIKSGAKPVTIQTPATTIGIRGSTAYINQPNKYATIVAMSEGTACDSRGLCVGKQFASNGGVYTRTGGFLRITNPGRVESVGGAAGGVESSSVDALSESGFPSSSAFEAQFVAVGG